MLDLAYKHKEDLNKKYIEAIGNDKYKWLFTEGCIFFDQEIKNDTWGSLQLVSIDSNGEILGFFPGRY